MASFDSLLREDDGRNLPLVPFSFESNHEFTTYKKQCEALLKDFYRGNAPLPVSEAIAISVLRANLQKRKDHQHHLDALTLFEPTDEEAEPSVLWEAQHGVVLPGDSIKLPLAHFMGSKTESVETGFRITAGNKLDPFDTVQSHLNALQLATTYDIENIHLRPEESMKVPRIARDRTTGEEYVVIKTKTRGITVDVSEIDAIESVGRRTGVVPLKALGNKGLQAAKMLARAGDSIHMKNDHREELKVDLIEDIYIDPEKYTPVLDRYYFARTEDDS